VEKVAVAGSEGGGGDGFGVGDCVWVRWLAGWLRLGEKAPAYIRRRRWARWVGWASGPRHAGRFHACVRSTLWVEKKVQH
jgi:hypothetical protein